jgi:hypothetical protein
MFSLLASFQISSQTVEMFSTKFMGKEKGIHLVTTMGAQG